MHVVSIVGLSDPRGASKGPSPRQITTNQPSSGSSARASSDHHVPPSTSPRLKQTTRGCTVPMLCMSHPLLGCQIPAAPPRVRRLANSQPISPAVGVGPMLPPTTMNRHRRRRGSKQSTRGCIVPMPCMSYPLFGCQIPAAHPRFRRPPQLHVIEYMSQRQHTRSESACA